MHVARCRLRLREELALEKSVVGIADGWTRELLAALGLGCIT